MSIVACDPLLNCRSIKRYEEINRPSVYQDRYVPSYVLPHTTQARENQKFNLTAIAIVSIVLLGSLLAATGAVWFGLVGVFGVLACMMLYQPAIFLIHFTWDMNFGMFSSINMGYLFFKLGLGLMVPVIVDGVFNVDHLVPIMVFAWSVFMIVEVWYLRALSKKVMWIHHKRT